MNTDAVDGRTLPPVSLALGLLSAALITVVSFVALLLAVAAIVTGLLAASRSPRRRAVALAGAATGLAAIGFFILNVL